MDIKYPEIEVKLTGEDGNAFNILGRVTLGLERHLGDTMTGDEIARIKQQFMDEATSGDYDNLLRTAMRWVSVS